MNENCILERVAETRSTNDDLMARWRAGTLIDPIARLSKKQTHGKGRAGRTWYANAEDSLSFSLAFPFQKSPAALSGLSLVAGLAVIEGICSALNTSERILYQQGLRLKWPNDIVIGHAKVGGILIEGGQTAPTEPSWMIIGVGLNVHSHIGDDAELKAIRSGPVGALDQLLMQGQALPDHDYIWLNLVDAFVRLCTDFDVRGFDPFIQRWSDWDAYQGEPVFTSVLGEKKIEGLASGIDHTGAYQIQTDRALVAVHAGDLSLRRQV
jgi:BirA family biotin operon repressor/biotin-[acetyl-CoA-carboxylase] ligase